MINQSKIYGEYHLTTSTVCKEFAQHLEQRHAERGRPEYSRWNKCHNILDDTLSADARFYYEKALQGLRKTHFIDKVEIAECLVGLAHLQKEDDEKNNFTLNMLLAAAKIYELHVGVDHPDTAFIYSKIGFLNKENSLIVKSLNFHKISRKKPTNG
jgi:hypothetical protein